MMTKASSVFAAMVAALFAGESAHACGGFFCQNQAPIDQAGENILFAVDGDEIEAHVQIQYTGKAHDFAWVVPVPAEPTLSTGVNELFQQLNARTLPSFSRVQSENWDECSGMDGGVRNATAESAGSEGEGEGEPTVDVTFQGAVGPYDAAVLTSDDADAVRGWLADNGYDIPEETADLLDPYVKQGDYFVALKLQSERETGDLVPIVLRFAWDTPCIPIRLTQIAAVENMTIRTWILGSARAIPTNYHHVLVDMARIDWVCQTGSNYTEVVTEAANEAEGQAFVTEYSGTSKMMAGAIWSAGQLSSARLATHETALDFLLDLFSQPVSRNSALIAILAAYLTPPEGMDAQEFATLLVQSCQTYGGEKLDCYDPNTYEWVDYSKHLAAQTIDATQAAADIEEQLVTPLRASQELLDAHDTVTVMFTTLSPDEMTLDPLFGFNARLPEVARVHEAVFERTECTGENEGIVTMILPDNRRVRFREDDDLCAEPSSSARVGTISRLLADLPGSERAESLVESSDVADLLYSNAAEIDGIIARHNGVHESGCGCALGSAASPSAGLLPLALVMLGLVIRRRR